MAILAITPTEMTGYQKIRREENSTHHLSALGAPPEWNKARRILF
jgi:hypothetical protein